MERRYCYSLKFKISFKIVIFYEHQLGLYPYLEFNDFDESTNDDNLELNKTLIVKYINGGLPQVKITSL